MSSIPIRRVWSIWSSSPSASLAAQPLLHLIRNHRRSLLLNRRTFLKHSSLAAGALAASRFGFAQRAHQPIGVQLYTVREQVESDLAGVLAQIHAIGYEEVEPYWNV